jgi:hypothetical protein
LPLGYGYPHLQTPAGLIHGAGSRWEAAAMKKRMLIGTLALGILLFAVAGWTVDGVRWAFTPLRPA